MSHNIDVVVGSDLIRAQAIGEWLEQRMPNPDVGEPQRWDMFMKDDETVAVRFYSSDDAVIYMLVWA